MRRAVMNASVEYVDVQVQHLLRRGDIARSFAMKHGVFDVVTQWLDVDCVCCDDVEVAVPW